MVSTLAAVAAGHRPAAGRATDVILCTVTDVLDQLRSACAAVATRATRVRIAPDAIGPYAASLAIHPAPSPPPPDPSDCELGAAYWLTLDAINFGSGWFPTLRKRPGLSGYSTIATALEDHAVQNGLWSSAELTEIRPQTLADILGQDPGHELMALYAASLNDLGRRVAAEYDGSFTGLVDAAVGSAASLVQILSAWPCFADRSRYDELELPFLKRAQIAAADLYRAGVLDPPDLPRLTMFADNLVPHVLRLDGVLQFDPELIARIDREELIEHGSPEEVEIRACALHAVELIVAARPADRRATAAEVDQFLWLRGQEPRYKASPRHRSRCTAY